MSNFSISGVRLIEHLNFEDHRGIFAKLPDLREIIAKDDFSYTAFSFNNSRGTFRGLHFQAFPSLEWKLVTCVTGAIQDFLVDVRESSETFGQINDIYLDNTVGFSILIPPGIAHGFQTLADNTVVHYQLYDKFEKNLERKLNVYSPELNIKLPISLAHISESDKEAPNWPIIY